MTQINDGAAAAREQSRDVSGEFGTQTHADSGIVAPPVCPHCNRDTAVCVATPCIKELLSRDRPLRTSVDEAVEYALGEHEDDEDEGYPDTDYELDMQIREISGFMTVQRKDLHCEAQYGCEGEGMYGISTGYKDQTTGSDVTVFLHNDDMFPTVEGTTGRERATIIATEIAKVYEAVWDVWHPEARQAANETVAVSA